MEPLVWPLAALLAGLLLGGIVAGAWGRARRRRMARELDETRRRLQSARAARETFFDLTTHELRSPLAAILGFQELLEDNAYGDLGDDARDAVERIGHSARHLLNLVDGVMELSRLRTGTVRPELGPVDTGVLLSATAEGFRSHAQERGLSPMVTLPDRVVTLHSDQYRLIRAFDLLITSAVRHPLERTMAFHATASDQGMTVTIGPTNLMVDPEDDAPGRGGIRLAVVDGIARLLGGRLELRGDDDRIRELFLSIPTAAPDPGL